MSTVLVTGGAGFIGSHLVRALLARGAKVRANLLAAETSQSAGLAVNVCGREAVS